MYYLSNATSLIEICDGTSNNGSSWHIKFDHLLKFVASKLMIWSCNLNEVSTINERFNKYHFATIRE